jgi:hypothetical protein
MAGPEDVRDYATCLEAGMAQSSVFGLNFTRAQERAWRHSEEWRHFACDMFAPYSRRCVDVDLPFKIPDLPQLPSLTLPKLPKMSLPRVSFARRARNDPALQRRYNPEPACERPPHIGEAAGPSSCI